MNELLRELNMEDISPYFDAALEEARREEGVPFWLTESFIKKVNLKTGVVPDYEDELIETLPALILDKNLLLFAKTVYIMLKDSRPFGEVFENFRLPSLKDTDRPEVHLLGIYPLLALCDSAYDSLLQRGIDESILKRTYERFNTCIGLSAVRTGRSSMIDLYFMWCILYAKGNLFKLGILEYEVCSLSECGVVALQNEKGEKAVLMSGVTLDDTGRISKSGRDASFIETESSYEGYPVSQNTALALPERVALPKKDWRVVLSPEAPVISVHIPAGARLEGEALEKEFNAARAFFKRYFPEYKFSAFICLSWLLSTDLKKILKPESNILSFASKFTLFPCTFNEFTALTFIFLKDYKSHDEIRFDELPDTTSLTRAVKEVYERGDTIREAGGYFVF